MKRHFIKKYIFSVLFLLLLFGFSALNLRHELPALREYVNGREWKNTSEFVSGLESAINDGVYRKYDFIEGYGFTETVLGSNIDNGFDFVKTKDGQLQYSNLSDTPVEPKAVMKQVEKVRALADKNHAETLLMLVPQKYIAGESKFAKGVPYSDRTEELDELKKLAEKKGLACIDTRDYFKEIKAQIGESVFYRTDHHWRPEAGFLIYGVLLEQLSESWKTELNPDGFYTNPDHYVFEYYENSFLGSMGRETGMTYAGLDDFMLIYPRFDTDFVRTYKPTVGGEMLKKEGPMYDSLLSAANVWYNGPAYTSDKYGAYLEGINVEDHITNRLAQDGPRILMIRDSYMSVPAVFLAANCSQLDLIWSINYDGDFEELLEKGDYDYVIVQLSGINLNNVDLLRFADK